MPRELSLDLPNLEATEILGRALGQACEPGTVIALVGEMGAGKTHLTRAIGVGVGLQNPAQVTSPTFVLIQEYEGRLPVYHFDTYRLSSVREFLELGAQEYLLSEGVCILEWADKVASVLPADRLTITLEHAGPTARRAKLLALGPRHEQLLHRSGY